MGFRSLWFSVYILRVLGLRVENLRIWGFWGVAFEWDFKPCVRFCGFLCEPQAPMLNSERCALRSCLARVRSIQASCGWCKVVLPGS